MYCEPCFNHFNPPIGYTLRKIIPLGLRPRELLHQTYNLIVALEWLKHGCAIHYFLIIVHAGSFILTWPHTFIIICKRLKERNICYKCLFECQTLYHWPLLQRISFFHYLYLQIRHVKKINSVVNKYSPLLQRICFYFAVSIYYIFVYLKFKRHHK